MSKWKGQAHATITFDVNASLHALEDDEALGALRELERSLEEHIRQLTLNPVLRRGVVFSVQLQTIKLSDCSVALDERNAGA